MSSYTVIVSVLFLLLLGWLSRKAGWITLAQKDGALKIVFSIFFPFLVFNLLASVQLKLDVASMVILLLVLYGQFYYLGRTILSRWLSPYSEIGAFLLTTAEGGNMALPLYLSIVGAKSATAGYPILLDLAGMIFCFIIIPVLVCARQEKKVVPSRLVLDALHSPMIIAALLGLAANLTGFYDWMSTTAFMPWYSSAISMVTSPIVPSCSFPLGMISSLLKRSRDQLCAVFCPGWCCFRALLACSSCFFQTGCMTQLFSWRLCFISLHPPVLEFWDRFSL